MTGSAEVWAEFTQDPRDQQCASLRASDRDRSLVQQVLAEAYADGRLAREEYDERSERAGAVRVLGDVNPLLRDLVAPPAAGRGLVSASRRELEQRAERTWQARRREAVFSFLGPSFVCLVIWFATSWDGAGFTPYFFWPGFVIVFTGLHLIRTATRHADIVEEEVRRLERRRAKELRARPRRDGTSE